VLLEVDGEAMNTLDRKSPGLIFFGLLTLMCTRRTSLDFHVRSASTVPVICLDCYLCTDSPLSLRFQEIYCDIVVTYMLQMGDCR
jgi:hypothetical protein